MAESKDNVFWGPLLEKAYAKFVGSYEKLSKGGIATEAVRAMTGWPGFVYITEETENVWQLIHDHLNKNSIVTCSNHLNGATKKLEHLGITTRNVYAVLGSVELDDGD